MSNQPGFTPMRSCATALIKLVDSCSKNMDEGKINGVLLVDLSKAFYTVNDDILLHKLKKTGCSS